MKQKISTFIVASLIYGLIYGIGIYYLEDLTPKEAVYQAVFFGVLMGLFEVFVSTKIREYFKKRSKKSQS